MAVRTITVTAAAYERLAAQKRAGEAFPDVILRLPGPPERARTRPRDATALRDLLLGVTGAPFEAAHAILAARLLADAARSGAPLDPFDAMVAAMAVSEDETLLTRNARELAGVAELRIRTY